MKSFSEMYDYELLILPRKSLGVSGPGKFFYNFTRYSKFKVSSNVKFLSVLKGKSGIFVVNGTRDIFLLLIARIIQLPIIYRVDGLHPILDKNIKEQLTLISFFKRLLRYSSIIFCLLISTRIVFQSRFGKKKLCENFILRKIILSKRSDVIYNGTDISTIKIKNLVENSKIICIEGSSGGSYASSVLNDVIQNFEIDFYGNWHGPRVDGVNYKGFIDRALLQNKILSGEYFALLVLELDANCPNAVIEALAFGLPVVSLETGSLPELVEHRELLVKNNHVNGLDFNSALDIAMSNWDVISCDEFNSAVKKFDIQVVVDKYDKVILNEIVR